MIILIPGQFHINWSDLLKLNTKTDRVVQTNAHFPLVNLKSHINNRMILEWKSKGEAKAFH